MIGGVTATATAWSRRTTFGYRRRGEDPSYACSRQGHRPLLGHLAAAAVQNYTVLKDATIRSEDNDMPRLRQVTRAEAPEGLITSMYNRLFGDRDPVTEPGTATGTPGNWWTVFALVPDVFQHATRGFALYASPNRLLDPVLRELGQTRAGWLRGSQFVYSQHCKSCRNLGMSEERIAAIASWGVADCFTPIERAVLAYTDELVGNGGRVHDATFAALKSDLSDEQILELTYITCLYEMHATMSRALRLEFDDRPDAIVEVPAPTGDAAGLDLGAAISSEE